MKRTLHLRKDVLTELTDGELAALAGADAITAPGCPAVRLTMPLLTCLFKCTE
jgi:hypothetical protein